MARRFDSAADRIDYLCTENLSQKARISALNAENAKLRDKIKRMEREKARNSLKQHNKLLDAIPDSGD